MDIIKIETPKAGFRPVVQYKNHSVYFFRFDPEETENETIVCNETTIMLKNATYETMVAALIAVKYSIDAQLALLYNYESDEVAYQQQMDDYQAWRVYCKDSARQFYGIDG